MRLRSLSYSKCFHGNGAECCLGRTATATAAAPDATILNVATKWLLPDSSATEKEEGAMNATSYQLAGSPMATFTMSAAPLIQSSTRIDLGCARPLKMATS